MTVPFTYIITHIPTGVKYYGARWKKGCHPNDLGSTYFSSSKFMKRIISEEGVDNFHFEIRKIFQNAIEAISWETKFLTRVDAARSNKWFNKHNNQGTPKFVNVGGYKLSERAKQNMRKPKSPEHKAKLKAHLDVKRVIPKWTDEKKTALSTKMSGERNHNFGRSDHPGAIKFQEIAKRRKGKTMEELYGADRAADIISRSKVNQPASRALRVVICPHCNKEGKGGNMSRYHFDNCKRKAV